MLNNSGYVSYFARTLFYDQFDLFLVISVRSILEKSSVSPVAKLNARNLIYVTCSHETQTK